MSTEGRWRSLSFVKWLIMLNVCDISCFYETVHYFCPLISPSVLLPQTVSLFITGPPPLCLLLVIRGHDTACRCPTAPGSLTHLLSAMMAAVWESFIGHCPSFWLLVKPLIPEGENRVDKTFTSVCRHVAVNCIKGPARTHTDTQTQVFFSVILAD